MRELRNGRSGGLRHLGLGDCHVVRKVGLELAVASRGWLVNWWQRSAGLSLHAVDNAVAVKSVELPWRYSTTTPQTGSSSPWRR